MSGPKSGRYTITISTRMTLAEQRRIAMQASIRRKQEELERIQKEQKKHLNNLLQLSKNAKKSFELLNSFDDFVSIYESKRGNDDFVSEFMKTSQNLQTIQQNVALCFNSIPSNDELQNNYRAWSEMYENTQKKVEILTSQVQNLRNDLMSDLESSGKGLFSEEKRIQEEKKKEKDQLSADLETANDIFEQLAVYQSSLFVAGSLHDKVAQAILKFATVPTEQIKSFAEIELQPLLRRCKGMKVLWVTDGAQYTRLLSHYHALLERNHHTAEAINIPFDANAIQKLTSLISKEETAAALEDEQEYIANAVSEVMTELGYNVWGEREVHKTNGVHFQSKLYHYNENTAINVTYRDNGQITMELGKADTQDRLPSAAEAIIMEQQMETFCTDFARVEAALQEKGVVLSQRVQMIPPSREFAQIINLNDFDVKRSNKASNRQEKTNGLQHMSVD